MEQLGMFLMDQVLKMEWLSAMIASALSACGLDPASRWGGTIHFFLYDTIKIIILLVVLIFVIGFIQSYFPPERSRRIMGRFKGISGNVVGALLGTVTPFCSCSSIPLFIGFIRAGLPLGVTFSFLISSPMVDLGSLVLIMSIFGPSVAVVYTLVGLVIAIAGGAFIERLHMERHISEFVRGDTLTDQDLISMQIYERLSYAAEETWSTFKKVFPYIIIGVAIGSLIHNWIPQQAIEFVLGEHNPFAVVLATIVGAPVYADTFGAIPIAEALYFKGTGLGTVLAFMMSVTVLSIPSLTMLSRVIKPRLMVVFIGTCMVGMIISGYVFNFLQPLF
ncbi:MAG: permease [Eggerthellaceae bacterium]